MNYKIFWLFIFIGLVTGGLKAQKPTGLTSENWREDIDSLHQQLPRFHANFFATYPRKDFDRDIAGLKANLDGKTDLQIVLELQAIVAKAGDGQTRLEFTPLTMHDRVIPYALSAWAGDLYVSATIKKFEVASGAKILKFNGLSAQDALSKMGRFVAQENAYSNQRDALTLFRFPAALRMAGISTTDTLALLVEKRDGRQELVKVYPMDARHPPSRIESGPVVINPAKPDLRWQQIRSYFEQQWLPKDSVLYIQYNRCISQEMSLAMGDTASAMQLPSFLAFSDSIFRFLAKTPYAKVLIDLRFNPGGNPTDGILWAKQFALLPKAQRPARLYVATNIFTQGAAAEIATTFSNVTGATLLGEPPATRPNHFDDVRQFVLPHSQVAVLFSLQYREVQKGKATVLQPKVAIPTTFEQYRDGVDPVLNYVREE